MVVRRQRAAPERLAGLRLPLHRGSTLADGTLFGVLRLGVINNLLNLVGAKSFYRDIVKGAVIILAVLLVATRREKK
jgi:ribose/xylose/arabinose/galactoside ABC-type transport system permease subunit